MSVPAGNLSRIRALIACGLLLCAANLQSVHSEDTAKPKIELRLDQPFLSSTATESGDEIRWLAVRARLTNGLEESVTVSIHDWQLKSETLTLTSKRIPRELQFLTVPTDDGIKRIVDLQTDRLPVASGESQTVWLAFLPLPGGTDTPELNLSCRVPGGDELSVDLVKYFDDRLRMKTERIGPGRAIFHAEISGEINTVNAGRFIKQLEQTVSQDRVARVVLTFGSTAKSDSTVAAWLRQLATQSGYGDVTHRHLPPAPSGVIDFHLVQPVDENGPAALAGLRNVHSDRNTAIDAAIRPLCELLPRETLISELRNGTAISRRAVLRHGAENLTPADLSSVIELTESDDEETRFAAIRALRHFGNDAAEKTLIRGTRSNDAAFAVASLETLADSRYGRIRARLPGLLKETSGIESQARILTAMGRAPEDRWSTLFLSFAQHKQPTLQRAALAGLVQTGHPQLVSVLAECLETGDAKLSATALHYLMSIRDRRAQQAASRWVLQSLETSELTSAMAEFLKRTRDIRAVSILLTQFKNSNTPHDDLVSTLLTIGDESVIETLAERFDVLALSSRKIVLTALLDSSSPTFWRITRPIMAAPKNPLFAATLDLLQKQGEAQSIELLKLALDAAIESQDIMAICQAIEGTANPAGRDLLISASQSDAAMVREAASASLRQYYLRSPAGVYLFRGQSAQQQENRQLAMLYFNLAIEADPENPMARSARGDLVLRDVHPKAADLEQARKDYQIVKKFDPGSSFGFTGIALVLVREMKLEEGIQATEAVREKFNDDPVYFYNSACVFGRVIEAMEARDSISDDDRIQIETYRKRGVADLRQSIENGLDSDNLDWMQRDPDLKSIRQSTDFEDLLTNKDRASAETRID